MRIERINDNQIRCTLTRDDLADRHIQISELAYGSEKAKTLFQDMMQQASYELGFEAEDIPLMIEAIPISGGSIILNITKIEAPDELDIRYSHFTDFSDSSPAFMSEPSEFPTLEGADDLIDLFRKIEEAAASLHTSVQAFSEQKAADFVPLKDTAPNVTSTAGKETVSPLSSSAVETPADIVKLFSFKEIGNILRLSHVLKNVYHGDNSLFLDAPERIYYLILHKSGHSPSEFNKVCNVLSEYALQNKYIESAEAYFNEHFKCIAAHDALQRFAEI